MHTQKISITPALAREYLATSKINRKLKESAVIDYAIMMTQGEWHADGPPLTFSEDADGRHLNNGHHRLNAVILADCPVTMTVQFGVAEDTREVEDSGVTRTLGDKLMMFRPEVTNALVRVAYLRQCVRLLSPAVIIRSLSAYDSWHEIFGKGVSWAIETLNHTNRLLRQGPVAGSLAFAYKTDPERVGAFGHALATGENLREGQPALTFLNFIRSENPRRQADSRPEIARKTLYAVRAHMAGQIIHRINGPIDVISDFAKVYRTPKVLALIKPWEAGRSKTEG